MNYKRKEKDMTTFVVRMNRREGESWYGDVQCADDRQFQNFDNLQEFLEVIDNLLNNSKKNRL